MTFVRRHAAEVYALLRIVIGFLFLCHGLTKIFLWPGEPHPELPEVIRWVAGGIELVGGSLVMVGCATRTAAFVSSGLMAFAYWLGHGTRAVLPINNQGELAVVYCFVFLYLCARGAGVWSIDSLRDDGE
jgi:putative oxidoreductase